MTHDMFTLHVHRGESVVLGNPPSCVFSHIRNDIVIASTVLLGYSLARNVARFPARMTRNEIHACFADRLYFRPRFHPPDTYLAIP